ncbi:hypothetical protein Btru_044005 [Bulinus truncatus]|nr:hypothetical protein Btru_044005 [Bulinus truncatus]
MVFYNGQRLYNEYIWAWCFISLPDGRMMQVNLSTAVLSDSTVHYRGNNVSETYDVRNKGKEELSLLKLEAGNIGVEVFTVCNDNGNVGDNVDVGGDTGNICDVDVDNDNADVGGDNGNVGGDNDNVCDYNVDVDDDNVDVGNDNVVVGDDNVVVGDDNADVGSGLLIRQSLDSNDGRNYSNDGRNDSNDGRNDLMMEEMTLMTEEMTLTTEEITLITEEMTLMTEEMTLKTEEMTLMTEEMI